MGLTLPIPLQAAVQGVSGIPRTQAAPAGVWAVTVAHLPFRISFALQQQKGWVLAGESWKQGTVDQSSRDQTLLLHLWLCKGDGELWLGSSCTSRAPPAHPGLPQRLPTQIRQGRARPRVRRPVLLRDRGQSIAVRFLMAACKMNAKHRVILKCIVAFLGTGVNYLNAMCFQS